jgi:predicted porin
VQRAWGADVEYSEGRFLARAEIIRSHWTLPFALSGTNNPRLGAHGVLVEGRYRLLPGVQLAARAERLDFSRLGGLRDRWEAPVQRLEVGASYSLVRNVAVKGSIQRNTRNGGRVQRDTLGAMQVVYWF